MGSGLKQIWLPNCHGAGCFANDMDQACAWCVYDLQTCQDVRQDCKQLLAARNAQNAHCLSVSRGSYDVHGYFCKGKETRIFYPDGQGPFPLVVYGHGMAPMGHADGREESLAHIASSGFVVLAPN